MSAEVIDIIFQNLVARPVPAKTDLDRNHNLVVLGAMAPALCLSLFWTIFTNDNCMRPDVKAAVVRNHLECGSIFWRWTQFCLKSGHPCLPGDELGGGFPTTEQDRYPVQVRFLLRLLDMDVELSQALLSSDAFIVLFLQLWNGEYTRSGDRMIVPVMDVSTASPCPIVLMALKIVKSEPSGPIFFQRFSNKRFCRAFVRPLVDRVQWVQDSPNSQISGITESLGKLFEIGEALWYFSALYRHHLRGMNFLGYFCAAWTGVSEVLSETAADGARAEIRDTVLLPTVSNLFEMALHDQDRRTAYHNWRCLTAGGFFELLFLSLSQVDAKIWSRVSHSVMPIMGTLLAYPRLIAPNSFGDISVVDVASSDLWIVSSWNAFSKAFHRTKAARDALSKRPPVYICDNSLVSPIIPWNPMYQRCAHTTFAV